MTATSFEDVAAVMPKYGEFFVVPVRPRAPVLMAAESPSARPFARERLTRFVVFLGQSHSRYLRYVRVFCVPAVLAPEGAATSEFKAAPLVEGGREPRC